MQTAPQESEPVEKAPITIISGDLATVEKYYREQRERVEHQKEEKNIRNSNGSQSGKESRRFAQPPAWESPGTMSTDERQNNTEEQESSQQSERRKRTGKQCLFVVAGLALAISGTIAGIMALAEWNKHKELAKFRNGKGHYAEHGTTINVKKERHWVDRATLTTAAQSILRDQSALSVATDTAERILLEKRIQSNREWAARILRNAHPFTQKILGAPDGNLETLLQNQESTPNDRPVASDK